MNFFERQHSARRNTALLVLYFVLAVIMIVVAVNVVALLAFAPGDTLSEQLHNWFEYTYWEHPTAAVVLIVVYGSLKRFFDLNGGGQALADMVGATSVELDSVDPAIRQYINVVEEMSIASGVSVPSLYVMEREAGINAFVAGYKPTEAVMVVTRGALQQLNRDELQGVIGHEFSHILNGDMRINVRLIAILAGILSIGQLGEFLFRSIRHSGNRRASGGVFALGLLLMLIGYVGLFFGRLIKAAISRQREFLADASSVQFTRNPQGIAGALYKIGQSVEGGLLNTRHAEDMSHMCFGNTLNVYMQSLLATHPPLDVRINAIDPAFLTTARAKSIIEARNQRTSEDSSLGFARSVEPESLQTSVDAITASVGNPTPAHLDYAAAVYQSFSSTIMSLVHTPAGAQAIVYSLLLARMEAAEANQLFMEKTGQKSIHLYIDDLLEQIQQLEKRQRLPLLELVLPTLKQLDVAEVRAFLKLIAELAAADKKISLFEFVLLTIINQQINPDNRFVDKVKYHSFRPLLGDIQRIISILVQSSGQASDKIAASYTRVLATFTSNDMAMIPIRQCGYKDIAQALNRLRLLSPMLKKSIIDACADAILDDGIVMPTEAELLRAVAESLDCPMPPLIHSA